MRLRSTIGAGDSKEGDGRSRRMADRSRSDARGRGLASTSGDAGALVQLASAADGLLNFSLDLRRIWSHDGKPLIPLPSFETFDTDRPTGVQLASGSYSQAIGSVGLRLGAGYLSLVGTYRKDRNSSSDYNIGPSINWPLVTRSGLQLVFDASAQRTRTTTAAFAGVRVLYTSGRCRWPARSGTASRTNRPRIRRSRSTGSFTAQYSHETDGGSLAERRDRSGPQYRFIDGACGRHDDERLRQRPG